jgi:hypothetical protein
MAKNLTTGLQRGLRRSIAGGLGTGDLFSTAALDLQFARHKALDPRITFTRASSGTYVGSDGLIKTAVTNLLTFSEQFDNAAWSNNSSSEQADAAVAPNGTTTADKLIENNTTNVHGFARGGGSESLVTGLVYTFSVYAKAGERSFAYLQATSNFAKTYFNLSTGVVSATGSGHTASITAAGNGWYRCAITFTSDTTNNSIRAIGMAAASGIESYAGDGTSGIYLWGAQLERSSTVGEYVKTTSTINSAPRFDHNPETGESLGLLVEESRTNLLLRSEEFDNASWSVAGGAVATAGTAIAPNGTATADTLTDTNGTTANPSVFQTVTLADSTTYTISCYLKAGTKSTARVGIRDKAGNVIVSDFNLTAGTTSVGSAVFSSIQPVGSGWYRCIVVANSSTGATSQRGLIYLDVGSYTQDGTGTLLVWGAQLEAGAFPTSYIPTTSATVTRSADVASITGANFSSWYRQDEGTVFAAAQRLTNAGDFNRLLSFNAGTTANVWSIYASVNKYDNYKKVGSGADNFISGPNVGTLLSNHRTAVATNASTLIMSTDGLLNTETAVSGMPTVDRLAIGSEYYPAPLNGTIRRLTYWPVRLANNVLQEITR